MAVPIPEAASFFQAFGQLDGIHAGLLALANVTLFGQDWLMFARIANGGFAYARNFREAAMPAYHGLLLPQAWTLGVEISFYVIAPFVLPRRWLMAVLFAASVAIRVLLIKAGVGSVDPWTYRFFPAELMFFLVGAFTQQFVLPVYRRTALPKWDTIFAGLIVVGVCS